MANKAKTQEQAPEQVIENALGETQSFFEKNWKTIVVAVAAIVVVVGGWFLYNNVYVQGQSEKASTEMFAAQQLFAAEQWDVALNGDGTTAGFLEVIDNYGVSAEANLANYYAGICYLNLGDKENAKKYLAAYKSTKGIPNAVINAQSYGLQGDIMCDEQNYEGAVAMYKKAVSESDNSLTAPMYLKKMGLAYEALGNYAEALAAYKTIEDKYPTSMEGRDITKYIGAVEQLQ